MRRFRAEWGAAGDADYLARVLAVGTTPNGVFATKLMRNELDTFTYLLRRLVRDYDSPDVEVIRRVLPEPSFAWITRRDAVAQAVSWAKAAQTGQYAAHQQATAEPAFDFEQIDNLLHLVLTSNGAWRRWFAEQRVTPVEVVYEDICRDEVGATLGVLAALGLAPDPAATIAAPPELTRQADEVNAAWISRYRELAAARAAGAAERATGRTSDEARGAESR